jgi:hypothetical protein
MNKTLLEEILESLEISNQIMENLKNMSIGDFFKALPTLNVIAIQYIAQKQRIDGRSVLQYLVNAIQGTYEIVDRLIEPNLQKELQKILSEQQNEEK